MVKIAAAKKLHLIVTDLVRKIGELRRSSASKLANYILAKSYCLR